MSTGVLVTRLVSVIPARLTSAVLMALLKTTVIDGTFKPMPLGAGELVITVGAVVSAWRRGNGAISLPVLLESETSKAATLLGPARNEPASARLLPSKAKAPTACGVVPLMSFRLAGLLILMVAKPGVMLPRSVDM